MKLKLKLPQVKLTIKLLVPLVLCVILGLGSAIFMAGSTARKGMEADAKEQLATVAKAAKSEIDMWLERNIVDVDTWSKTDSVIRSLGAEFAEVYIKVVNTAMEDFISQHGIFVELAVADPRGIIVASSDQESMGGADISSRKYLHESLAGKTYISEPLISLTTERPIVVISAPVKQGDNIIGILLGVVDLGDFTAEYFDNVSLGSDGYLYMTNAEGLVIAYPPDKKQIMKLSLAKFDFGKKILEMNKGYYGYTYKGVEKQVAFDRVKHTNWLIAASKGNADFYEKINNIRRILLLTGAAITVGMCLIIVLLVRMFVVKPINEVVSGLEDISQGEGDLTKHLRIKSKDELGELATTFNGFMDKLRDMIRDISTNVTELDESSTEMGKLSTESNENTTEVSKMVLSVATAAEEMNTNFGSIAASMTQSSANLSSVATATEEMSATINEIAQNSEKARSVSEQSVQVVQDSGTQVEKLASSVEQINAIVEVINDISEQVNLLSLNATIEAARAGEAGKGFAVVANEIKDLANQTSEASGKIKDQISGIQSDSTETIESIKKIESSITDVNEIIHTIATAVEEQSAATGEITNNISHASMGVEEVNQNVNSGKEVIDDVTQNITQVKTAVDEVSESNDTINQKSDELNGIADKLRALVNRFKV